MRRVITGSPFGRGGWSMTPASGGSTPSASAGAPSVTRLIQRICVASSGSTKPSSALRSPITSASSTPKNIVITSPMFDDSR